VSYRTEELSAQSCASICSLVSSRSRWSNGTRIERLRPPGAVPFILDEFGGSGWMTRLPDGTLERYYVDLPSDTNYETPTFHVGEPPATHLGKTLADTSVNALATLYVAYLSHVFSAAYQRFS
jgi:hypothetical protein